MKQIGGTVSRKSLYLAAAGHLRDTFIALDRSLDRRDCPGTCPQDRTGHTPSIGVSCCPAVPLGNLQGLEVSVVFLRLPQAYLGLEIGHSVHSGHRGKAGVLDMGRKASASRLQAPAKMLGLGDSEITADYQLW